MASRAQDIVLNKRDQQLFKNRSGEDSEQLIEEKRRRARRGRRGILTSCSFYTPGFRLG
jgi:hypothetical protein